MFRKIQKSCFSKTTIRLVFGDIDLIIKIADVRMVDIPRLRYLSDISIEQKTQKYVFLMAKLVQIRYKLSRNRYTIDILKNTSTCQKKNNQVFR